MASTSPTSWRPSSPRCSGRSGSAHAPQVYQAIITNEGSFRLALVVALTSGFLFLMVAWGLYVLLRPVNRNLALLFLLLNAVGVAIQGASMLGLVSALLQSDASSHMGAYSAAQLEGLAYLSINVYKAGWVTAQLFFATWLFPLGYLVYRSGFLPRFLGVLLVLDGIAVLIWFLQALLLPDYPAIRYPGLVVSFVAELGLGLWLLVKGVRVVDAEAGLPVGTRPAGPQAAGAAGMKAVVCTRYGPPEVLRLEERATPVPRKNEVRIRVLATAVTSSDCYVRGLNLNPAYRLMARLALGWTAPRQPVLGMVLSGEVDAVGPDATSFEVGDRVFGFDQRRFGTYAQFVCWPEDGLLATRPANLTDVGGRGHSLRWPPRARVPAQGRGPGGTAYPRLRSLRRGRHVRRAARTTPRRQGHGCLQHLERGPRGIARRDRGDRLHRRGLHRPGRAVRPDPRRRGQEEERGGAPAVPASAGSRRRLRLGRRREAEASSRRPGAARRAGHEG